MVFQLIKIFIFNFELFLSSFFLKMATAPPPIPANLFLLQEVKSVSPTLDSGPALGLALTNRILGGCCETSVSRS